MTDRLTAREQLLEVRPQSEQVMNHLLDAYRDQVLTEAADVVAGMVPTLQHEWPDEPSDSPWARGVQAAERELRALTARTGQEATANEPGRLIETISEVSVRLEQYRDRLVFEYPDVADALQPLIDQLNHAADQEN